MGWVWDEHRKNVCRFGQPLLAQANHVPSSYTIQEGTVNHVGQVSDPYMSSMRMDYLIAVVEQLKFYSCVA